jgi:transposase-like protein
MRLLDYMKKQGLDDDSNEFRMLSLKLVKERTQHEETIKKVAEKHDLDCDAILGLRELLNKDLKRKGYRGVKSFDFVLDEGTGLSGIKLEKRKKDILKKRHLELENELALVKQEFEKKLKENN